MIKKEVVEVYHRTMLLQGYTAEEAEAGAVALGEVLTARPHMVPTVGRILINPAPSSWIIDQPAGARMPSEIRERLGYLPVSPELEAQLKTHKKQQRSIADKERRKRKQEGKRRRAAKLRGTLNTRRKPNKQQRAFNSVL